MWVLAVTEQAIRISVLHKNTGIYEGQKNNRSMNEIFGNNKGRLSIIYVFVHFYIFTSIYLHIDLFLCMHISKTGGPNIRISPDWLHWCNWK